VILPLTRSECRKNQSIEQLYEVIEEIRKLMSKLVEKSVRKRKLDEKKIARAAEKMQEQKQWIRGAER